MEIMEAENQNHSDVTSTPVSVSIDKQSNCSSTVIQISTPAVIPVFTPNGTRDWIPACANELKPALGMKFDTLDLAVQFYKKYASVAGFSTRRSTSRRKGDVIKELFYLCNKEGYKRNETKTYNGKERRKRTHTRCGCKAKMIITILKDRKYTVTTFVEEHNHELYTPRCLQYQKEGRNMGVLLKKMVYENTKMNIGPSKTFRQAKEMLGGYENIGATKIDFKNFQRDLKAYIKDSDGQMFIDTFEKKKSVDNEFFFEYELDDEGRLCRILWADSTSRRNYAIYGDIVSFDTTYSTNRYSMVFGPFTGIDNHKACITFAACFVANEDIISFNWVFKTFLKAMANNEPTCLITDQDPAMLTSFKVVFKKTEHRLCMWHIMKKMSDKIGPQMQNKDDFINKINKCVWNVEIEPQEFEKSWKEVITEFKLEEHRWLSDLYKNRTMWIPAYFRDCFLTGLMRTTSRSESENNFFTNFTNAHLTLVEFNTRFQSSMETQRYTQAKNDNDNKHSKLACETRLLIEKNASEMYTKTVFYEFRKQVVAALNYCGTLTIIQDNETQITTVVKEKNTLTQHQVVYNTTNNETTCSCKKFIRIGIPCKHMITVWKDRFLDYIPQQYLLDRWTILAAKTSNLYLQGTDVDECARIMDKKRMLTTLWTEIHMCVSLAEGEEDSFNELLDNVKRLRTNLEANKKATSSNKTTSSKIQDIEMLIGATTPTEVTIKPPKISKNKGTGIQLTYNQRRLKGAKELAIEKSKKKSRKCTKCGEMGNHNSRTCKSSSNIV